MLWRCPAFVRIQVRILTLLFLFLINFLNFFNYYFYFLFFMFLHIPSCMQCFFFDKCICDVVLRDSFDLFEFPCNDVWR